MIVHADQLRGMLHPLRPCHFAHVDKTFDSLFELDEGAVIGHADYPSVNVRPHRIAVLGVKPWIGGELLETEGYTLLLGIEFKNFHLNRSPTLTRSRGCVRRPQDMSVM